MLLRFLSILALLALPAAPAVAQYGHFSYADVMLSACDNLRGKSYDDVAKEIDLPHKMMVLCEQAGVVWPVKGIAATSPNDDPAAPQPFPFADPAAAKEAAKVIENFNIWYSTDFHFGMRMANYTKAPLTRIVVGFKPTPCGNYAKDPYHVYMQVEFNPLPPGYERVLKWRQPAGVRVTDSSCMDVLMAAGD